MKLAQQRNRIRPEAVHVVRGHQGNGSDMKITGAGAGNLKSRVAAVSPSRKSEGKFGVGATQMRNGNRLPVPRLWTPDQRHLYRAFRRSFEPYMADVLLALHHRQ